MAPDLVYFSKQLCVNALLSLEFSTDIAEDLDGTPCDLRDSRAVKEIVVWESFKKRICHKNAEQSQ